MRHKGWTIVEEWVVSDQEVSGRSLAGRDAMDLLKRAAKGKPRPFDCVLIDDTSRFGRNLGDVLKLAEFFKHYDVSLHFVSPPLDSGDPNFYQLLVFKGMMDEQYSVDLAHKVRRGQEGRVLAGYNAGGPCYGYRNVPEMCTDGKREIGVRLEIIPEQEAVVLQIFEMYAKGFSLDAIARTLRTRGIPSPRPATQEFCPRLVDRWHCRDTSEQEVHWNKRAGAYDGGSRPETGRCVTRSVPEEEWVCRENPKWRIVSDELWNKVQEQLALKRRFGIPKNGGLTRTERSRKYLLSGLISCGICNGPISIVDGTAGGEIVRYGCSGHRYKGACTNAITIRRDSLEEQFLRWLTYDLLQSDRLQQAASSFHAKVQNRISELQAEARKNAVNAPELHKELEQKKREAWNITDVIASMGRGSSPMLQSRLQAAEARMREIAELLVRAKEPEPIVGFSVDEVKQDFLSKLHDLQAAFTGSPQVGRQILQKHIRKITLTPGEIDSKRVFHVTVEFELGGGNSDVVLTGSVDASMQQYGFSTIVVTGLTLDTSRIRRKTSRSEPTAGNDGGVPALTPTADTPAPVQL